MAGTGAALPNRKPYIVTGSAILLRAIAEVSGQVPDVRLVSVAGPPEAPERLVMEMSEPQAELFAKAFPNVLQLEPDLPLPDFPDGGLGPV
jgi:hypothetical protein